jgi:beta-glucosidase
MVPYAQTPESEIDSDAHRALALKTARESIVLLKNDGILPLSADVRKIVVVGPLAESVRVLHGNYSGTASHATTALDGIQHQFHGAQVTFFPGMNFLRQQSVIPSSALSTDDGQVGLKGEYFSGKQFEGKPVVVRVDKMIDLQLFHPDPMALTPPTDLKDFSVRWTGFLTPNESGTYEIGLTGSMNQLWIDGQLIVDDLKLHDPNPITKTLQLKKGHRYAVKLEYVRGGFGTKLVWLKLIADPIAEAVAAAKQGTLWLR